MYAILVAINYYAQANYLVLEPDGFICNCAMLAYYLLVLDRQNQYPCKGFPSRHAMFIVGQKEGECIHLTCSV